MGRIIRPDEIKKQAAAVIGVLQEDNRELEALLEEVEGNIKCGLEPDKRMQAHCTILQGMLCVNDIVIAAHETMIAEVGTEDLVENDLLQVMEQQQHNIEEYQKRCETYERYIEEIAAQDLSADAGKVIGYCYDQKKNCREAVRVSRMIQRQLQEKMDKISEIERKTNKLYDDADFLYQYVEQGLAVMAQGTQETAQSEHPECGRWQEILQEAWRRKKEQALI